MRQMQLEVYSDHTNMAVIKMPGRRYPGVLMQGDTLNGLLTKARLVVEKAKLSRNAELVDEAEDLAQELENFIDHYELVLKDHGIPIPYPTRAQGEGNRP